MKLVEGKKKNKIIYHLNGCILSAHVATVIIFLQYTSMQTVSFYSWVFLEVSALSEAFDLTFN